MPLPPLMFMRKQYEDFGLKTLPDSGPCNPPTDRVTRRVDSQSHSSSASPCSCSFVCCCSSSYSSKEKENAGFDNDDDDDSDNYACWACYGPRDGLRKFPPAIQVPAKLGDLTTPVPKLLERSYEAGGRLVLRKVTMPRHEFLKAQRENGRLTLKLMYMDEDEMPMQVVDAGVGRGLD